MKGACLIAVFLIVNLTGAEAADNMSVCYILDGILILYGIVLTVLYCRLKMRPANKPSEKQPAGGGIYAGLSARTADTYETINVNKKHPVV
ncbi:Fc receptor, IgE, high affinity I, gamma polypeptide like [Betta splendens]|uniref:Fc receptor, IgE, high affinity I, gamma polypeptide like n=1 Tax=Betta splendens TaxID=158456 RepID=A0A6P7L068_BETSP|nr:Fc receptor, IgE, high affinity I, gamma polypeptide like [Betta splendens]